jgi:hypothetical protein
VTLLVAAVALDEERRVVIRVLVKLKAHFLVGVHGVRMLLVDSLDEL